MIDLSRMSNIVKNRQATDCEIDAIENEIGATLPKVYEELLKSTNGFSVGGGLIIYGTEDIFERNLTWEVKGYAKGYVAVGDDGGGNVFLMLQDTDAMEVLVVDSGDMNPHNAKVITSDFINWIENGCPYKESEHEIIAKLHPDFCDIILINAPDGGLKDMLQLKSILGLDMPSGELLKGSKSLPFLLVKSFPYGKAKKLIEKLGVLGEVLKLVPTQ